MLQRVMVILLAIGVVILTILFIDQCGPRIVRTADYVRPVTNGSFDSRVEDAAYRGATRAIKPHHDADMQEHARTRQAVGVAQDSLNGIASCMDCKDKKPVATPRPIIRRPAPAPAAKPAPDASKQEAEKESPFGGAGIFAPTPEGVVLIVDGIIKSARETKPCCNEHHEATAVVPTPPAPQLPAVAKPAPTCRTGWRHRELPPCPKPEKKCERC